MSKTKLIVALIASGAIAAIGAVVIGIGWSSGDQKPTKEQIVTACQAAVSADEGYGEGARFWNPGLVTGSSGWSIVGMTQASPDQPANVFTCAVVSVDDRLDVVSSSVKAYSAPVIPTSPAQTTTPRATNVELFCLLDETRRTSRDFNLQPDIDGRIDFGALWAANARSCTLVTHGPRDPQTPREVEASTNSNIGLNTLYPACGEVDPEDRFITTGFVPSSGTNGQAAQIRGQLILCPDHPHAGAWTNSLANADAVIARETADAELESAGLKIGAGTVLVGSEVKPGTYISEGTIKDCYWARQDGAGGIIENQFIPSARRVEVTIKATDYAFDSSSCGQWRAAG